LTPAAAYRRLFGAFGPQGWWPVAPSGGCSPRYHPGRFKRPGEREALEICLGAILTQNTAWTNVERALESLLEAKAVDAARIVRMPSRRLERLIRSSGFYAQKAKRLKNFARRLLCEKEPLTRWLRSPLPDVRAELLSINGVGPETADSMLLYAAGRPTFVVDAYTRRIGERLGWFKPSMRYEDARRFFESRLPDSPRVYQELHALLVELGKRTCRKRPLCARCPLRRGCPFGMEVLHAEKD
jgi:endonuclease III related protein